MTMIHQTEERGPAVALPVSPSLRNGDLPSAKKRSRRKVIMNRLQAKGSKRSGGPESIEIQPVRDRGGGRRSSLGGGGTAASAGRAAPMSEKELYVKRVVDELVETEKTYVANLRSIIEDYLSVIIDRKALPLTCSQVYTLFGNIECIYPFNSDLLQSLEDCAGDVVAIANCFVLKSEDFKIYTQYCTNYPSSMAILSDCMKNKTLVAFFRERQTALRHSLPLGSYLLKPVQRILKYHLFLQDIAKRLDNGAEGHDVVNRALAAMHGVAQSINEMKRKHEHAIRAQEIQGLLVCGKLRLNLDELGELVQEGTFQVKHGRKERTLFLFAKALLVTKRRLDGTFTHKSCINCDNLMMSENTKEQTFSVWNQRDPKTRITFQTKLLNEQRLWTFHLKKLILKSHPTVVPERAMQVILDVNLLADQNTPEGKPEAAARRPGENATSDSPPPPLPPHDSLRPPHRPPRESSRSGIARRPSHDSADPGSPWSLGGHGGQGAPAGTTPRSLRRDAEGRGSATASLRGRSSGEGSSEETAAAAAGVTSAMTPHADEVASRAPLGSIDVGRCQGFTTAQCPAEPTVPSPAKRDAASERRRRGPARDSGFEPRRCGSQPGAHAEASLKSQVPPLSESGIQQQRH
ncbi:pleckstrin homology domain-containing family G member 1-like isoform X2 [Lethenteron reissneri]|uniref:pleckstrin homology domain-containing family G member 1-like isoform X2 n=1 Tax=Lethenteron reissneri TaxID=7753 RepID=UPI002AB71C35|nr:pleckstrin homology domain-containing family G member 1-like isoform X2 [Lethenteron reissneri]XP_061424505.1 pleckstrin homology domain-containing family G member 1-like isoform X2 [Lethenteron reissneri]XP_061424506.1 pleckstrin homology domain-containing family G member 1-like isoform X2 [Lethenteron reissneri]XP_061424507.1 pleckstrin homology domain-containing family G member 1-like isoform X2 [Lethenteron reissneri]